MDLSAIRAAIEKATGTRPEDAPRPVGGGCINETFRLGDFFVKVNTADREEMFAAEQLGLDALRECGAVRVPEPLCCGSTGRHSFLVLEYLPLTGSSPQSQEDLGSQLASLHRTTANTHGWVRDNFIGATPQPNPPDESWVDFLRDHRLGHMFRLADRRGFRFPSASALLDSLDSFFDSGSPPPSLLHGDLWGGNAGSLPDHTPVLYDPAVYFGDREADLAMTTLFGGFSPCFYAAYEEAWPLPPGAGRRRELYNLYHLLNHAVLFGAGYARQAETTIERLLR